ncbi:MAG TPA: hypothetical protein VHZ09_17080 [Acidobacteriaceae bacterium]|nr:hypothetical protein [Acidobacteriaceae bacterium]
MLERAEQFHPLHVLPGQGDAGGPEILTGQRIFLRDLYDAVKTQAAAGRTVAQLDLSLPERDRNWTPRDLNSDFAITYSEITQHKPAGEVPHVWK